MLCLFLISEVQRSSSVECDMCNAESINPWTIFGISLFHIISIIIPGQCFYVYSVRWVPFELLQSNKRRFSSQCTQKSAYEIDWQSSVITYNSRTFFCNGIQRFGKMRWKVWPLKYHFHAVRCNNIYLGDRCHVACWPIRHAEEYPWTISNKLILWRVVLILFLWWIITLNFLLRRCCMFLDNIRSVINPLCSVIVKLELTLTPNDLHENIV